MQHEAFDVIKDMAKGTFGVIALTRKSMLDNVSRRKHRHRLTLSLEVSYVFEGERNTYLNKRPFLWKSEERE